MQSIESQAKSNEVNSNYGIGVNATKLQKPSTSLQNQSLFNIGTQSAKNLGQFPGTTKQQPISKNIATVPKIFGEGSFKINLTGQDQLPNNSRRSGLFKIKNGPEQKVTSNQISNLIQKQKQNQAKSITSQVPQNLVASPLTTAQTISAHSAAKDRRAPEQQYSSANIMLTKNLNTASAQTIGQPEQQTLSNMAMLRKKTKPLKSTKSKGDHGQD
jgi:hypothetical protein